jgi:molybdate transport system substrate-binding protein
MRTNFLAIAMSALPIMASMSLDARAETVEIYSAGSATAFVNLVSKEAGPLGIEVKATFSPAGKMRDRIEAGEKPDLFLSADMTSPRKLASDGHAIMPVVPFAQNRMCLTARNSLGVTEQNIVERMLAKGIRIKTNEPIVDPAGDFAVAIFDRIDALHKGAGQTLRASMQKVADATKSAEPLPGHSANASLFLNNQVDMAISFCSVAPALKKEVPDVTILPFPASLDPHPVYGMAILSTKPEALRLALFILSERGQALVKEAGLMPVSASSN